MGSANFILARVPATVQTPPVGAASSGEDVYIYTCKSAPCGHDSMEKMTPEL